MERVLDLIGRVYDAALDEKLWPDFAPAIAGAFESSSTTVFAIGPGSARYLSATGNQDQALAKEYEEYYHRTDVWVAGGVKYGAGRIVTSQEIMPEAEFAATEFYQDFVRRMDIFHLIGSVVPVSQSETGVLGIHRPRASGVYEEEDKALVSLFLPHLQRALQLRRRLVEAGIPAGAAFDALERSGTATVVVSREGRVLYANREAERLARTGEGIAVIGGRLAIRHPATQARLMALIREAVDTAADHGAAVPCRALAIARDDRLPLTVLVAPLRPAREGFGAALPAAIVFLRDPERPTPMSLILQGLFGLTPAEAAIAALLAGGRAVEDIAARQRIAANTVRVHLKSIFTKTDTTRQAQLVALILCSVAPINGLA